MGEGLLLSPWSFHRSHATPEGPPCLYPFPTYVLSRCYHWLQGSFRIPKFPSLILNSSYNIATHIPKYINWPLWMVMPFGSHSMLLSPFREPFETQVPTSLERPPPGLSHHEGSPKGTHPKESCQILSVAFICCHTLLQMTLLLSVS